MTLKRAGVDISVIALWLGHEDINSTQIYIHADLELKERALARTTPTDTPPGRYKAPDQLFSPTWKACELCRAQPATCIAFTRFPWRWLAPPGRAYLTNHRLIITAETVTLCNHSPSL